MSIIKINELQPTTGTTVTITGNTTTTGTSSVSGDVTVTGNTTVAGTLSGSVVSGTFHGDGSSLLGVGINVQETDGSPAVTGVKTIKVTTSTLTDNGSGVVTIDVAGDSNFRPNSVSSVPAVLNVDSGSTGTFTITGRLFASGTTVFSSSNPAIIDVVSQTYVNNITMTVVLTGSGTTTGSISLYAKNGARADDTPLTFTNVGAIPPLPNTVLPLLYFDFEEGTGTSVGNKSNTTYVYNSGSTPNYVVADFTGTLETLGSAAPTWFSGSAVRGTYSLHFIQNDDGYINMGDWTEHMWLDFFQTSGSFTISTWVRGVSTDSYALPRGYVFWNRLWLQQSGGYAIAIHDSPYAGKITWAAKKNSGNPLPGYESSWYNDYDAYYHTDPSPTWNTDTWYHLCWVVGPDSGSSHHEERLYIDGVQRPISDQDMGAVVDDIYVTGAGDVYFGTIAKPNPMNTLGIRKIGAGGHANYSWEYDYGLRAGYNSNYADYVGLMDEFSIWSGALGPKQVAYIYNSGSSRDLSDGIPAEAVLP